MNFIKKTIRYWLLNNPKFNPFRISFKRIFYQLTNNTRVLPDFIIIGSGRAGTTALYSYLIQHPQIMKAYTHEKKDVADLHFFEYMISDKIGWYRAHFPTKISKRIKELKLEKKCITGEFTSTYMYNKKVPDRIKEILPNVKILLVLRNPIDKIYSTYSQQYKFGEYLSNFEDIINSELNRMEILEENPEFLTFNENIDSFVQHNILRHGIYHNYLKKWYEIFCKEQIMIIDSEQLKNDTLNCMKNIFEFLEIEKLKIKDISKINEGNYKKMDIESRKKLVDYFSPHNKKLNTLLKSKFIWDN